MTNWQSAREQEVYHVNRKDFVFLTGFNLTSLFEVGMVFTYNYKHKRTNK